MAELNVQDVQRDILFAATKFLPEPLAGAVFAVGLVITDYLLIGIK